MSQDEDVKTVSAFCRIDDSSHAPLSTGQPSFAKPSRILSSLSSSSSSSSSYYHPRFTSSSNNGRSFIASAATNVSLNGRYEIEGAPLEEGVTAVVVRARDLFRSRRRVCVKILHAEFSVVGRQEAETLRRLTRTDPNDWANLLRFRDGFSFGPHFCLVTDLIDSSFPAVDFRRRLAPLTDAASFLHLLRGVAFHLLVTLGFFRWTNFIHADVKPENILIAVDGDRMRERFGDGADAVIDTGLSRVDAENQSESGSKETNNKIELSNTNAKENSTSAKPEFMTIPLANHSPPPFLLHPPLSLPRLLSAKLIDYGNSFSDSFQDLSSFHDDFQLQSLLYRAPEIFFGVAGFDAAIDVWSLGAVLAELFVGRPLFEGSTPREVVGSIVERLGPLPREFYRKGKYFSDFSDLTGRARSRGDIVESLSNAMETRDVAFVDFVARCLEITPSRRMTPAEAARHAFLAPICPVGFLTEPRFDSRRERVPYEDAGILGNYEHKMARGSAGGAGADPTFVRAFPGETVPLGSDKVLTGALNSGTATLSAKGSRVKLIELNHTAEDDANVEADASSPESFADDNLIFSRRSNSRLDSAFRRLPDLPADDMPTIRRMPDSPADGMPTLPADRRPASTSQLMAMLESEERRLDDAEKNQNSLKRKAKNLSRICEEAKSGRSPRKEDAY